MNIEVVDEFIDVDKSTILFLKIPKKKHVYVGYILESFEGWCFHSIVNKGEPLLQLTISPDYVNNVKELIGFFKKWEI
ncbi:MAG: hypothetical protein U9N34_00200 [Candidatus Cloacimonadota bacterium]|nr:hypothetical protein [Candidatus Cloacimonadota bacterium]